MSRQHRRQSTRRHPRRKRRILDQHSRLPLHHRTVRRHQKVFPRREQPLRIVPRRRDQRNAAGQCLEHADGGDARQVRHVEPPRHVDGEGVPRKGGGRGVVRQPTVISRAIPIQHRERLGRIAHAMDIERDAGTVQRGQQETPPAPPCARRRPSCRSTLPRRARRVRPGGWNNAVSAASCQTNTRPAQPQPRYTSASVSPNANTAS